MAGIGTALAAIMRDVGAIGKDSVNQGQGFRFRGIDAVMDALHPVFAKHGVIILPEVLEERAEERQSKSGANLIWRILKVKFHFKAEDGSGVDSTVIGEGMDSGDKGSNKALAVALKYALTQMLLLPYNEVDPDADTPPPSTRKEAAAKAVANMPPEARETFNRPAPPKAPPAKPTATGAGPRNPMAPASEAQIKKLYAMCKGLAWVESEMKTFVKKHTGKDSTKDLTMGEIQNLYTLLDSIKANQNGEVPPGREPGDE